MIRYSTMTNFVHSGAPERERMPLRQRRPRAAATTEFGRALATFGLKQRSAARWFCTSERNVRRWKSGTRKTPPGVAVVIQLMLAGKIGPADVELAAGLVPGRINGDAKPEPPAPPAPLEETPERATVPDPVQTNGGAELESPAPVLVEPAPGRTAPAHAPAAAVAILTLNPGSCRWPLNDPWAPRFFLLRP